MVTLVSRHPGTGQKPFACFQVDGFIPEGGSPHDLNPPQDKSRKSEPSKRPDEEGERYRDTSLIRNSPHP